MTTGGGRQYIGVLEKNEMDDGVQKVWLKPAYEMLTMTRQEQVGPQQVKLTRESALFPVAGCSEDVRVRAINPPDLILCEEDLTKRDLSMFLEMVRSVQAEIVSARAQKSGLAIAGGLPGGGRMPMPPELDPRNIGRGGPGGRS